MEIIGDDLLRIVLEREEADVAEDGLKSGRCDVRPVQHPIELGRIGHVAFERRQEDLRCVREHDHTQRYGKVLHVHSPTDLGPAPLTDFEQAVREDDEVDEQMRHGAPEAEHRDGVDRLEESQWHQEDSAEHHPGPRI